MNEIFYSIQGEGMHTGEAAIFVRFSGCNLECPFCDTEHLPYQEFTEDEIVSEISRYPARLVVVTGGEPTLQLTMSLVDKIHKLGKYVAVETNGTRPIPYNVDWVTVSPKATFVGEAGMPVIKKAHEVKIVLDDLHTYDDPAFGIKADNYLVQPCDTTDEIRNKEIIKRCISFVEENPLWKLSLQIHKILDIR
ncbi:MAG: 7-carboxy-7-deazaguanine synthase QueE [Clostridium sp.]|nr:7-carboxy-7-deazaguanine synthase QueE [Clostridium sp.]